MMAMNNRTLRPSASGFTPRSISGLALWLDASSADTLYTTDAGPVTAVAAPTDIAGCVGWWDCSRTDKMFNATTGGSLVADGGAVLRLEDLSGNGKHLIQATSASAPSRQDGAKNGLPALNFAGTKALAAGAAGDWNFLHNTQGGTVIAVIKPFDTADPNTFAYGVATNIGGATNGIGWSSFFDDRVSYPRNNYVSQSVTAGVSGQTVVSQEQNNAVPSTNDFSLLSFTPFAGSSTTAGRGGMYVSGTATGNANSSTLAPSASNSNHALTVGVAGGNSIAGLAELIVYNTALSTAQRASVEAYLAQRWGISGVHAPATATSDPVGAWLDKSGNARHATQSTAGSRPTVSVPSGGTEMVNGRRALLAFSSNAGGVGLGNIGSAFPNSSGTAFFAYKVNDGGTGIDNSYGIAMSRLNNSSTQSSGSNEGFWRTSRLAGTNPAPLPTSGYGAAIYTINSAASGYTLRYNSAPFYTTATQDWNAGNSYYLWSDPASNMTRLGGWIGEAILYNRSLSASETRRVEQYLSSRWAIAIAPQVANADAQDWINRVYANGGTVSASTASAVNTLCDSLDAASLRDRFYRLNLFCGTGLNAALVPLYRGPSLGGTQYGNTTDTNNAFVGVGTDYAETGAGGGLLGNGTSKYLNTGLTVSNIGTAASGHMSAYHGLSSGLNSNRYYMGANDASTSNRFYLGTDSFSTATVFGSYGAVQNATQSLAANGHGPAGHRILSRETDSSLTHYHNGSVVATNTTLITPAVSTAAFAVFAANRNGTVDRFHNSWIAAYSIGLGFNSAQAAAYRDIMQTFQTALGRNV
jgi:heme/copper-type cytochrome/quinol oxidase subunit 3